MCSCVTSINVTLMHNAVAPPAAAAGSVSAERYEHDMKGIMERLGTKSDYIYIYIYI